MFLQRCRFQRSEVPPRMEWSMGPLNLLLMDRYSSSDSPPWRCNSPICISIWWPSSAGSSRSRNRARIRRINQAAPASSRNNPIQASQLAWNSFASSSRFPCPTLERPHRPASLHSEPSIGLMPLSNGSLSSARGAQIHRTLVNANGGPPLFDCFPIGAPDGKPAADCRRFRQGRPLCGFTLS